MEAKSPATKYCIFTERDHDIWEFQFVKAHNLAVDEWVAWQDYLSKQPAKPGVTMVRTLLDFRPDGPIPLLYALQKNNEWRKRNPNIDPINAVVIHKQRLGRSFSFVIAGSRAERIDRPTIALWLRMHFRIAVDFAR